MPASSVAARSTGREALRWCVILRQSRLHCGSAPCRSARNRQCSKSAPRRRTSINRRARVVRSLDTLRADQTRSRARAGQLGEDCLARCERRRRLCARELRLDRAHRGDQDGRSSAAATPRAASTPTPSTPSPATEPAPPTVRSGRVDPNAPLRAPASRICARPSICSASADTSPPRSLELGAAARAWSKTRFGLQVELSRAVLPRRSATPRHAGVRPERDLRPARSRQRLLVGATVCRWRIAAAARVAGRPAARRSGGRQPPRRAGVWRRRVHIRRVSTIRAQRRPRLSTPACFGVPRSAQTCPQSG